MTAAFITKQNISCTLTFSCFGWTIEMPAPFPATKEPYRSGNKLRKGSSKTSMAINNLRETRPRIAWGSK